MSEEKKSGSLGFFSSYDDLSDSSNDSDSDEEGESRKKHPGKDAPGGAAQSSERGAKRAAGGAPLPRPDELFGSVSRPAFLYNPLNKQIDWDSLAVKAPEEVRWRIILSLLDDVIIEPLIDIFPLCRCHNVKSFCLQPCEIRSHLESIFSFKARPPGLSWHRGSAPVSTSILLQLLFLTYYFPTQLTY